jgi:nicotinamide mononucleotide adenylyltransferase
MGKYDVLSVHGRFQPPLHINHWNYIKYAFDNAAKVRIYITNPFANESFDASASWRNDPSNNPFSFDQRKEMFDRFFKNMSIDKNRYTIETFNITEDESFSALDSKVPMVVNVYSEWSAKKVGLFEEHGIPVIKLVQPKKLDASGTKIRHIIKDFAKSKDIEERLIHAGFMPEAIDGLKEALGEA